VEAFEFEPFDPTVRREPFALYARARREHPVYAHPGLPIHSVFRHEDVLAVLKDPATWSNVFPPPPGMDPQDLPPPSMLSSDPPDHTRLRGLVSQAFTPRAVRRLEPRIEAIAHELLEQALRQRTVDLVEAFATPLPVIVIAEMLGVPSADRVRFKGWSDVLVESLGSGFFAPLPPEQVARFRRARAELEAYLEPLVAARRAEPREDLLSGLVAAELEGSRLSFAEMIQTVILLLVAGNETTTTLIGNAVLELMARPEVAAEVRAETALVPGLVEEVLRYSSPVQMDPRFSTREVELRGVRIPKGQFALCWIGSANRDEAVFPEPERFDLRREGGRHVAFGFGIHYCLGANLARLEAQVALRTLLARTRGFTRLDSEPLPLHPSIVFRAVTRLPLALEPAAGR
jgi:cytochrome P450